VIHREKEMMPMRAIRTDECNVYCRLHSTHHLRNAASFLIMLAGRSFLTPSHSLPSPPGVGAAVYQALPGAEYWWPHNILQLVWIANFLCPEFLHSDLLSCLGSGSSRLTPCLGDSSRNGINLRLVRINTILRYPVHL